MWSLSYFYHFPVLARIFWRSSSIVDHFLSNVFRFFDFTFFLIQKHFCGLIFHTIDFRNIDTSRNVLSEGGPKQSLVPLQHRVSIATATGRERGVGFEGLDPADLLRRIVYVGSGQWERRKGFERGFDRLVDFSFAFPLELGGFPSCCRVVVAKRTTGFHL